MTLAPHFSPLSFVFMSALSKEHLEIAKRIEELNNYVSSSLTLVEAKHASFVALLLVFLSGVLELEFSKMKSLSTLFFLLSVIELLICMGISLWALYPRASGKRKYKTTSCERLLFRCETLEELSKEQLQELLKKDCSTYRFSEYEQAKIESLLNASKAAARKYRLFRCSLQCFAVFIVCFLLLILSYILL